MKKAVHILILGATITAAVWFLVAGKKSNSSAEDSAAANYMKYCSGCHGAKLEKFAAKQWMDEEGITPVFNSIKFGLEDLGMPAFEKTFTDSEIESLAAYVKKGIPADRSILEAALTTDALIESEVQKFTVDTVVSGLNVPWGMAFLPNGDMLISERSGSLYIFSGGKLSDPVEGVPRV